MNFVIIIAEVSLVSIVINVCFLIPLLLRVYQGTINNIITYLLVQWNLLQLLLLIDAVLEVGLLIVKWSQKNIQHNTL